MENQDLISAIDAFLAKNGKGNSYLVKKITSLFESSESPLNLRSGALKNLKDSIKTFDKNLTSTNKNIERLSDKLKLAAVQIKIPKLNQLGISSDRFSDAIKVFSKNLKSVKPPRSKSEMFPNTTVFAREIRNTTNKLKDFRSKFKSSLLEAFFNNLKTLNTSLKKANKSFGPSGIETSVSSRSVYDVRIVDLSAGIKSILTKANKSNTTNVIQNSSTVQSGEGGGGFISTLIKGLLGGTALLAGVGFVSKYFQNNPAAKTMFATLTKNALESLSKMKTEISKIFGPIIKTIGEYAWDGAKLLLKQIPKLFSSTFNFFGLKDALGEENEGLAVIITKGIYASIKGVFLGLLNKSTFGMFGAGMNIIRPQLNKLGTSFMQNGVFGTLKLALEKIFPSIADIMTSISKSIGSATGSVGKFIGSIGKTFSNIFGTAFSKLLGGGLKVIGKRIPLVGTLISFVDAYDRFKNGDILGGMISVGSGIATIFPGIGTAISIGLDVLNAILDNQSASTGKGKGRMLLDFAGPMLEKISDSIGGFLKGIWEIITNILSTAKTFVENKAKGIHDFVYGKVDSFTESLGVDPSIKASPQDQMEIEALRENARKRKEEKNLTVKTLSPPKHINDGEIIIPNKKDAHIFAKEDGPFNKNLVEMNNKMTALISVFAEGVQIIANTTSQGSSSIVNAVVSTGSKESSSVLAGSVDPIGEYRLRAARAIEYASR